ncbi:hypothetical protein OH77DRAFT_68809 [Trametes cingulata]|nr:hypothetical protein OH77DRAFT_68809 [Trametes cingulata]
MCTVQRLRRGLGRREWTIWDVCTGDPCASSSGEDFFVSDDGDRLTLRRVENTLGFAWIFVRWKRRSGNCRTAYRLGLQLLAGVMDGWVAFQQDTQACRKDIHAPSTALRCGVRSVARCRATLTRGLQAGSRVSSEFDRCSSWGCVGEGCSRCERARTRRNGKRVSSYAHDA